MRHSLAHHDLVRSACEECQIRDLLSRVAHLGDGPDAVSYAQLFTDDAVCVSPVNPALAKPADTRRGRGDIEAGARERRERGMQGPGSDTRHVVTTVSVEVAGTVARAVSYWLFYVNTAARPTLSSMGTYQDDLRVSEGRWRIAHRIATLG